MEHKTPSLEQWQRLYQLAVEVKAMAPWNWMMEDDLFGVENPDSDEMGFVSVMGAAGEHFAVTVYLGSAGLRGFMAMHEDGRQETVREIFFTIPQVQVSFEDRDLLTGEDRGVIKTLGLKFRGRNAWPWFRSYLPGYAPFYLSAAEARFLTCALEQVLIVAPRFREDLSLFYGEEDEEEDEDRGMFIRAYSATAAGDVWTDRYQREFSSHVTSVVVRVDNATLDRLGSLPQRKMIVEIDAFMLPQAVQEGKSRPKYAYPLMLVDADSGYVLGFELMHVETTLEEMWSRMPGAILDQLAQMGLKPSMIKIRPGVLQGLLEPVAKEVGIKVQSSARLPMLDEAKQAMLAFMG